MSRDFLDSLSTDGTAVTGVFLLSPYVWLVYQPLCTHVQWMWLETGGRD